MSPLIRDGNPRACRFPRVSGDEPSWQAEAYSRVAFSPRERG